MSDLITLKEVATRLRKSYDWLARSNNRERLYRTGFPRPLNIPGHPLWRAQDIENYIKDITEMAQDTPINDRGHRQKRVSRGLDKFLMG